MSNQCLKCGTQKSIKETENEKTQRAILKQSMVMSSLYTMNIASMNTSINTSNEGNKHDSYERYLMKKKGNVLSQQSKIIDTSAKGNKTKSYALGSLWNFCECS